jgi:hypothetical protein
MWAKIEMAILYCSFAVGMTTKKCTASATVLAEVKYLMGKARYILPRCVFEELCSFLNNFEITISLQGLSHKIFPLRSSSCELTRC